MPRRSNPYARIALALLLVGMAVAGCSEPRGGEGWLQGTVDERFARVADQLGGFDQTMIEVAHRYAEAYWSAQDGNLEYAAYQLEEMEEAIRRGLERRPARAASAQGFLTGSLPDARAAAEAGDIDAFREQVVALTGACNACHLAEDVAFIRVAPPEARATVVRHLLR